MIGFSGGCGRFRRELGLLRDGYLSDTRVKNLKAHLEACESCRVARDLAALLGSELAATPEFEVSPSFDDRVMGAVLAGKRSIKANWLQWKNFALGLAGAGLAMGVAIQLASMPEGRPGVPPPNGAAHTPQNREILPPGQLIDPHNQDPNAPLWRLAPNDRPGDHPFNEPLTSGRRLS